MTAKPTELVEDVNWKKCYIRKHLQRRHNQAYLYQRIPQMLVRVPILLQTTGIPEHLWAEHKSLCELHPALVEDCNEQVL